LIFRITHKLGKKIGFEPYQSIPLDSNPFIDWSAHLFTAERVQYIMVTNTLSLYSIVMYGKGITNESKFINGVLSYMKFYMCGDGNESIFERYISSNTAQVFFSKNLNRAVTGSMNDLIFHAKIHLIERNESPYNVSVRLNEIPMSYLRYDNPRNSFRTIKF